MLNLRELIGTRPTAAIMAPSLAAVSTIRERRAFTSSIAVYSSCLTQTLLQLLKRISVRVYHIVRGRLRLKCDGTRAETKFHLSGKRTSPFKSAGASVHSTAGSRGVRFSGSNAGLTKFRGSVKGFGSPLHRHFPLHFPSSASQCAITFQLGSTEE